MKRFVWAFAVIVLCACGSSKKKAESSTDPSFDKRLAEYLELMDLNDKMNLERMLDYIYPKLFTIAPKEEVLEAMKDGLDNEEVKVEIDSVKIDKIYPVFEMENGSYAMVNYSMVMLMDFKGERESFENKNAESVDTGIRHMIGSDKYPAPQVTLIQTMLAEKYGDENVSIDKNTGKIKIRVAKPMIAVKDSYAKEWCFVSFNEDDPMINMLFSKEVLKKLATYK